jgi:hypothetical protein
VEEMCGALGSGSCMEEVQDGGGGGDDVKPETVLSFTEALRAFESMRVFMYAHITERDQANTVNIESLLFNLKRKVLLNKRRLMTLLKRSNTKWT